jgi:DNA (cytosine-5)-methyltransferase 1
VNYYNEFNPAAAAWLRELISLGVIPDGHVDTRSITEVKAHEIKDYTQCHFFAGIGGWSHALKLAGWPATRPVWTGSCPCQPFSSAGKGLGTADVRHLWPVLFRLIAECRPDQVFGEQVSKAIGKSWLDGVCSDLETEGYACGAVVLGAHSAGAPNIRQRLYWMADADVHGRKQGVQSVSPGLSKRTRRGGEPDGLADADCKRGRSDKKSESSRSSCRKSVSDDRSTSGMADADCKQREQRIRQGKLGIQRSGQHGSTDGLADASSAGLQGRLFGREDEGREAESGYPGCGGTDSWSHFDVIPCADGKSRRVESGVKPLVGGLSAGVVPSGDPRISDYANRTAEARVMRLHGYGNSIVPQTAAMFITAAM